MLFCECLLWEIFEGLAKHYPISPSKPKSCIEWWHHFFFYAIRIILKSEIWTSVWSFHRCLWKYIRLFLHDFKKYGLKYPNPVRKHLSKMFLGVIFFLCKANILFAKYAYESCKRKLSASRIFKFIKHQPHISFLNCVLQAVPFSNRTWTV